MSWRDNLLPATLDGIEIFYEEVSNAIGRRGAVHEFVRRDDPFPEDMGRLARRYQIKAFVLGENYAIARDDLIEALEADAEHTFVHPYRGELTVRVIGEVRYVERPDKGRCCEFDLKFVESGLAFPLTAIATAPKIAALKAEALEALGTDTKFSVAGAVADVISGVTESINEGAAEIRKANGKIAAGLNRVDSLDASIEAFTGEVASLLATPTALINKLTTLVGSAFQAIDEFRDPDVGIDGLPRDYNVPQIVMQSLRGLYGFSTEPDAVPIATTQSELERAAHTQLQWTLRSSALASAAASLVQTQLASADEATEIADELAGYFDAVLVSELAETVRNVFASLKATTVLHFARVAQALPNLNSYTPAETVPALVLAYEIHGDAARELEVVRRNKIRHPLFTPGGQPLEVVI